uniref:Glycophorin-A n=1 Tax=Cebus imitator TaxID=2715852 RepID=A0A2K5S108_CEBIM
MYGKIIFALLLSEFVNIATSISPHMEKKIPGLPAENYLPSVIIIEQILTTSPANPGADGVSESSGRNHLRPDQKNGERQQLMHDFSEPVITLIIFGVMAAVIGKILFISYCIRRLRKKSSFDVQPHSSPDTDVPLSSVEIENSEKVD